MTCGEVTCLGFTGVCFAGVRSALNSWLESVGLRRTTVADLKGPLAGIKIVDLSVVIAGPYGQRCLAELGANVVKVESLTRPDVARGAGHAPVQGMASLFHAGNIGKRSIVLDLKKPEAIEVLMRLVVEADVVVQNFRPGAVDRMGIGYEACKKVNPNIIYLSSSGFGPSGPYTNRRIYDPVIQATSGMCHSQAESDDGVPQLVGHACVDKFTSLWIAQAVLAAIVARDRGAGGQHIDISMLGVAMALQWPDTYMNHVFSIIRSKHWPALKDTYRLYETSDGARLAIAPQTQNHWDYLCKAFDKSQEWAKPEWKTFTGRLQDGVSVYNQMQSEVGKMQKDDLISLLKKGEVPHSLVLSVEESLQHKQVTTQKTLLFGKYLAPRQPIRFSKTHAKNAKEVLAPGPMVGEHTNAILREVGFEPPAAASLIEHGAALSTQAILLKKNEAKKAKVFGLLDKFQRFLNPSPRSWKAPCKPTAPQSSAGFSHGPFQGIRVVDLSRGFCGPFATMMLADQGAEVIKVESSNEPDLTRTMGPCPDGSKMGASHMVLNRNKQSMAIDWDSDAASEILLRLVKDATIVVEDFGPGIAQKKGIGYEQVKKVNADIIYISIDTTMPDAVVQCQSGTAAHNPSVKAKPSLVRQFYSEKVTGIFTAVGISAALVAKHRGKGGEHIEISMLDASLYWNHPDIYWNNHWLAAKAPPKFVPFNNLYCLFPTKEGENMVQFFGASDIDFAALCRALEKPEWIDEPKWKTLADRAKDWSNMIQELKKQSGTFGRDKLLTNMNENDCAHAKVLTLDESLVDPQVQHMKLINRVQDKKYGRLLLPSHPANFHSTPCSSTRQNAPELGQHTSQVLEAMCGYTPEDINKLKAQKAVY